MHGAKWYANEQKYKLNINFLIRVHIFNKSPLSVWFVCVQAQAHAHASGTCSIVVIIKLPGETCK